MKIVIIASSNNKNNLLLPNFKLNFIALVYSLSCMCVQDIQCVYILRYVSECVSCDVLVEDRGCWKNLFSCCLHTPTSLNGELYGIGTLQKTNK